MKLRFATLLRILVIALAIWAFFFVLHPSRPPDADESLVIVLLGLGIERFGALIWRSVGRRRRRPTGSESARVAKLVFVAVSSSWLAWGAVSGAAPLPEGSEPGGRFSSTGEESEDPVLVCRPARPVVPVGGGVELRAFVAPEPERPVWTWAATAGEIVGTGDRVSWELGSTEPGYHTATADLETADGRRAACTVRVRVRSGTKGGTSLSGRSFLDCGSEEKEARGYGLYSYLLFGAMPSSPETANRYLAALRVFVDLARDVEEFQLGLPRREIHVTYVAAESSSEAPDRSGELPPWLLEHYDWSCAAELLAFASADLDGVGPYIVSVGRPLASGGPIGAGEEYLHQDMSLVNAELMELWIREFLIQTRQASFWEPRTGPRLALQLRTTLSVLAQATDAVRPALSDWLQWLGPRSEQPPGGPGGP